MDGPRPAEFLKLNPRALVPVLIFNGEIIIESAIICQFLADVYPSHLCPPSTSTEGALRRARISYFTDAYWSKFHTTLFKLFEAPTDVDVEKVIDEAVAGLLREVEPLLNDANPFFGGSDKLTLAEVSTLLPEILGPKKLNMCMKVIMGPFVIRAITLSKHGVYPKSLNAQIQEKTPNFHKWATAVSGHPSITSVFDESVIVARSVAKRERMRIAAGLPL